MVKLIHWAVRPEQSRRAMTNPTPSSSSDKAARGIGILAYGSLRRDPGVELGPLIQRRIPTRTPFGVEFARISRTRGGAPTVVPHSMGVPLAADILVLKSDVTRPRAMDMLWRRETRQEGSGKAYCEGNSPNSVIVRDKPGLENLAHVLYTDFAESGKVERPDPVALAEAAARSVAAAPLGFDGISYLMQFEDAGVETALMPRYRAELLRISGCDNLLQRMLDNGVAKSATLLYLFWEPGNAGNLAVCQQHRQEIEELAAEVAESKITFRWTSYPQLWEQWSAHGMVGQHVCSLRARYQVNISEVRCAS